MMQKLQDHLVGTVTTLSCKQKILPFLTIKLFLCYCHTFMFYVRLHKLLAWKYNLSMISNEFFIFKSCFFTAMCLIFPLHNLYAENYNFYTNIQITSFSFQKIPLSGA